jgi:hypothetical protein
VKVDISQDTDVSTDSTGSDPVVVVADFAVEVIQELEQGPPGPASEVPGPIGPPGPQGPTGTPGLPGNQIHYGIGNPTPEIGINGDSYINTANHFLFGPKAAGSWPAGTSLIGPQGIQGIQGIQGVPGPQGIQGVQGNPGVDGNTVLYGAIDPTAGVGVNGNFFINTTSHFLFGPKAGGAWPAGASLVGPQGIQGVRGTLWYEGAGAPGAISGVLAGDNYLNTTNGDVYSYSGSSWGSPVGNIRGPQGIQGIQGIQGPVGPPGPAGPSGPGSGDMLSTNNLSDVANVPTSRLNLGIRQEIVIAAGSDLNTITNPGTYITADNACTNVPVAGHFWHLEVLTQNSGFVMQRATMYEANIATVYVRNYSGTWGSWHRLMSGDNNLIEITVPATARGNLGINQTIALSAATDLNTLTAAGTYSADPSCVNLPIALTGYWYLEIVGYADAANYTFQRATRLEVANGPTYVRSKVGAAWGAWQQVASMADVNATYNAMVRYDAAQALNSLQQQTARVNIYAAPFDAQAFNGLQINGAMEVSQENGTASVALVSGALQKYIVDGWQCLFTSSSGGVFRGFQSAGNPFSGYPFCFSLQATTAMASVAAGDYTIIQHPIEGYRMARLGWGAAGARAITIGFWIIATVAGTASVSIHNGAGNRCYVANFTVNAAATWEYKTITVGGDTAGTWTTDKTVGMWFDFSFDIGSNFYGTPNAWQAGNFYGTSANTHWFGSVSNTVQITGVTVTPGSDVPSSARANCLIRPFDQELALCKRHWEKSYDYTTASGAASYNGCEVLMIGGGFSGTAIQAGQSVRFKVEKRSAPSLKIYSVQTGAVGFVYDAYGTVDLAATVDFTSSIAARVYSAGAAAAGLIRLWHWVADARL